jgi:hypothetical protein
MIDKKFDDRCQCYQDSSGSHICHFCYPTIYRSWENAPQEKQLIDEKACGMCLTINGCDCEQQMKNFWNGIQYTSEIYDHGRYIVVQDGDCDTGNHYTAHIYFTSKGDWEIEETINTFLGRS